MSRRNKARLTQGKLEQVARQAAARTAQTMLQGAAETIAIQQEERHFTGPIPPPDLLVEYDKALPGAAERILSMAERQATHRQELEKKVVFGGSKRANTGLVLGFVIALTFLGVGAALIVKGYAWEGTTIASVDVASLAAVFVVGRREQTRERARKQGA